MNIEAFLNIVPPITDINRPYWDGCEAGELRLQRCNDCGTFWFPEAPTCPNCLSGSYAWKPVSGRGKVWSSILMHQKYVPAYADEVPYLVAMIELEEGPCMYSTVVDAPEVLPCDTPVEVVFEDIGGRVIPKFRIAG